MADMFFDNGQALLRTLIVGVLAYIGLILLLRMSGRRTLSKMNAFDLVVTVALGSTFASILLSKNVSLAQGILALALLIGLQYLVTWTSVRVSWVRRLVTGEPALLLYRGQFLSDAMRTARVTEEEIHAAIRSSGSGAVDTIEAVVLETDGTFSVVRSTPYDQASSLAGVKTPEANKIDVG
jgi:uncharacterized membrane protein YcaP (DUF421 family)